MLLFHKIILLIENQFRLNIKIFESDVPKYYANKTLNSYSQKEQMLLESSCVSTLQQYEVVEKKNGHHLELIEALLCSKEFVYFWRKPTLTINDLITSRFILMSY